MTILLNGQLLQSRPSPTSKSSSSRKCSRVNRHSGSKPEAREGFVKEDPTLLHKMESRQRFSRSSTLMTPRRPSNTSYALIRVHLGLDGVRRPVMEPFVASNLPIEEHLSWGEALLSLTRAVVLDLTWPILLRPSIRQRLRSHPRTSRSSLLKQKEPLPTLIK